MPPLQIQLAPVTTVHVFHYYLAHTLVHRPLSDTFLAVAHPCNRRVRMSSGEMPISLCAQALVLSIDNVK
jgi:hypothetical protein